MSIIQCHFQYFCNVELSNSRIPPYALREMAQMNHTNRELLRKRIEELCKEINPYGEISAQLKTELFYLGIVDFGDPFHVTSELLLLLDELS